MTVPIYPSPFTHLRGAFLTWPVFNASGHEPRDNGAALPVNKAKGLWIENPPPPSPLNRLLDMDRSTVSLSTTDYFPVFLASLS